MKIKDAFEVELENLGGDISLFAHHRLSEPLDGFASEFKLRIRCT